MGPTKSTLQRMNAWLQDNVLEISVLVAFCGLLLRVPLAIGLSLNADEALHYLTAAQHDWHGWAGFYRNAIQVTHPPLFIPLLRAVLYLGHSELSLRLLPLMAGVLFPWFVMLWVRRFAGDIAGLCALMVLNFSPGLIRLGIEVRAYMLAFLFLSISLLLLEVALERGSVRYMLWFHAFLYLSILTEYCVVFYVAAAGLFGLLRLWGEPRPARLRTAWAAGQAGALGLYAFLFVTQLSLWPRSAMASAAVHNWLRAGFVQPGDSAVMFAVRGTLNQFTFLAGGPSLGMLAAGVFILGVCSLWRKGFPLHATLLALPFCLACLAAILGLFPYSPDRHTAVLGIFAAAGMGHAATVIFRNKMLPALAILLLIGSWSELDGYRHRGYLFRTAAMMRDAARFLRTKIPIGSVVVTDSDTDLVLAYYLESHDHRVPRPELDWLERESGGLRIIAAPAARIQESGQAREAVCAALSKYSLRGPVWVAAGGFGAHASTPSSRTRPFGQVISIFPSDDPAFSQ